MSKSLVLSGGGAKGSFEAGILYELFDHIEFDYIHGTSVGALNGLILCQCYLDKSKLLLKDIWTKQITKNKHVFQKKYLNVFTGKPPLNFSPLRKIIKDNINLNKVINMNTILRFTAVDLNTGEAIVMSNQECGNSEDLLNSIIASATIPPAFSPVEMGEYKLVDGGTRDNVPIKNLIRNENIESALILLCNPKKINEEKRKYNNIFSIGLRTIDIMTHEITVNDVNTAVNINELLRTIKQEEIEQNEWLSNKRVIDIDIIEPEEPLGGTLNFNHEVLLRSFLKGRLKGKEFLEDIKKS